MARLMNDNLARRSGLWLVVLIGLVIAAGSTAYYRWSAANQGASPKFSHDQNVESAAGKHATLSDSGTEAGRTQNIEQSAKPVDLTPDQKQRLRDVLARARQARQNDVGFSLTLGSAVPQQVALADLPTEASDILRGYSGDKYLVVGDQLVIVDPQVRRIVALIQGVA
jgi:hypothetical protein